MNLIDRRKRFTIIIPIIIYLLLMFLTTRASRSSEIIMIGQNVLPLSTFAGVFSSIGNTVLVIMVLFYKRLGFITALILILAQSPTYIAGIIATHSLAPLPGMFSAIFTIIMIVLIYINHVKMEKEQKRLNNLFKQTATALVNAIDAKDAYTQGHSMRVAQYSRMLAQQNGKSEDECEEIYYAALLHDVGKIGVPESIISKKGKLTPDEYEAIKQHPSLGAQILQSIREFPYLSIGAHGHHERYDGKGYPFGLKGTDIPEIARIVAVADAYDAMTSKRSYRDPIPQQIVREEIVKGSGTQFDPEYARIMLHVIDEDTAYEFREHQELRELDGKDELDIDEYRSDYSEGIHLTPFMTTIYMKVSASEKTPGKTPEVSLLLFDSLDERVHKSEKEIEKLLYFEYGELWLDGRSITRGARKIQTTKEKTGKAVDKNGSEYKIEAVRIKDHALISIIGESITIQSIIALPDNTRFIYISLTGEHCRISNVRIERSQTASPADFIPRIAEKISFINVPAGDIPNVEIDGYRTASSDGIKVKGGMHLLFHSKSLPTARLVWHCPFIVLFSSDDGKVAGQNYKELAFIRLDGEAWEYTSDCSMDLHVEKSNFEGWDVWKKFNKDGYEAKVKFSVKDNKYTTITSNCGISIRSTVTVNNVRGPVYATITGDQVAITNIRIISGGRK